MQRFLIVATTLTLIGLGVVVADDPPTRSTLPAQPDVTPLQPPQPVQPFPGRPTTAATLLRLEEEVETLEAHRETKKAYVVVAEVAVKAAQVNADRIAQLIKATAVTREEFEKAKLEVEAARAQLDVRLAEVKEVEVKIKFAKKRLEAARAGVRNPAKVDPEPIDSKPAAPVADPKAKLGQLGAGIRPDAPTLPAAVRPTVAVFNVAAVIRQFGHAQSQTHGLNEKRKSTSKVLKALRAEYVKIEQNNASEPVAEVREKNKARMDELDRKIQEINKALNDEASRIISTVYDEIKTAVDKTAEMNGYHVVFAYSDGVTAEELRSPMVKELKLKPLGTQPFFTDRHVDVTKVVIQTLNAWYPAPPIPEGIEVGTFPTLASPPK